MAEFWRRAASRSDDATEAESLRESAARSEELGELAGQRWPVSDSFGALDNSRCTNRSARSTLTIRTR